MILKRSYGKLICAVLAVCILAGAAAVALPRQVSAAEAPNTTRITGTGFYFDTVVTLVLYGPDDDLLADVWAACGHYENLLSKTVEGSDVYRINHAGGEPVTVDPETWNILREAQEINRASDGAFSITIAPIVSMWDFTGGSCRMPTDEQRLAALTLVDDSRLVLGENNTVTLPAGMEIDLGGIAKGYIADKVAELIRGRVYGATISLGGNTYVVGQKPTGTLWAVGIQDPNGMTGTPLLKLSLQEGTVVTSGVYERYFKIDGVRYHHILDPQNGLPAWTGLVSASVICESSMVADAVATACIVVGPEKAIDLMVRLGVDGLLITEDGTLLETPGFTQRYDLQPL